MRKAMAILAALVVLGIAAGAGGGESLNEMLGYQPDQKLVIVNGDDAGMCHSADMAVIDCMENGLMTSSTIMVPCPWFKEIAKYAKEHPEKDFGVHLTHTSEWGLYRWGPVAGKAAVPGLVDPEGYLWEDDEPVWAHATADEAEREARAQIERALAFGVDVTHIDSHMGAMQLNPEYLERYMKLAREYDLPARGGPKAMIGALPQLAAAFNQAQEMGIIFPDELIHGIRQEGEPVDVFWKRVLRNLEPGVTELYIHATLATDESKAITGSWADRAEEHRLFTTDPEVRQIIKDQGIVLIGYRQLRDLQRLRHEATALAVTRSASPTAAGSGEVVTYTFTYSNTSDQALANIKITDQVPATCAYVPGSARLNGLAVSPDPYANGTISVAVGTLAPGAGGTLTYQVTVK